jgi:hypothetical protein
MGVEAATFGVMSKKTEKRRHKRLQRQAAGRQEKYREIKRRVDEQVQSATQALRRLVDAASDATVAPADVAGMVVETVAGDAFMSTLLTSEDMAWTVCGQVVEDSGAERALELATALEGHLDDHPGLFRLALSLAAEAGDLDLAERIAERALTAAEAPSPAAAGDAAAPAPAELVGELAADLASIRWLRGRLGDALELVRVWSARRPESDELMDVRASLIAGAAGLESDDPEVVAIFSKGLADDQREPAAAALTRFGDRSLLYRLRDAVEAFIAAHPGLAALRDEEISGFFDDVADAAGLGSFDQVDPGAAGLVAERFWLSRADGTDGDDDPHGADSVLAAFAADPATPPDLADAAREWLRHVRYGLWLADWQAPAGTRRGLWMTDIVTRRRVYASIPPEQLDGLARWTVLVGALVPVEGVWRSGKGFFALDPTLADRAAEAVLFITGRLVADLARQHGLKPPGLEPDRRDNPRPHGVLSEVLEPMDEAEAEITAKVTGSSLSHLFAMVEADRHRSPAMSNTDGEPIELISVFYPVAEPELLRRRLRGNGDFDEHDDGTFAWLGRLMTAEEAANAMAQFRAQATQHGWGEIEPESGPRRWLRGTLRFEADGIRAEVNSRARFDAITAQLGRLGAGDPVVEKLIDPSLDLPAGGGRLNAGRSLGPAADAAWMDHWLTEKVPALDGARPVDAARDRHRIVLVEKLLRRFEHDADETAAAGEAPMDVAALRARLGMEDGLAGAFAEEDDDDEA